MVPVAFEPELPATVVVIELAGIAVPTAPFVGPAAESVGVALETVKVPLDPVPVNPPPVPERVYALAALITRLGNDASPEAFVVVALPAIDAVDGLVANVTLTPLSFTALPNPSST
jgi:hypothetical protein